MVRIFCFRRHQIFGNAPIAAKIFRATAVTDKCSCVFEANYRYYNNRLFYDG